MCLSRNIPYMYKILIRTLRHRKCVWETYLSLLSLYVPTSPNSLLIKLDGLNVLTCFVMLYYHQCVIHWIDLTLVYFDISPWLLYLWSSPSNHRDADPLWHGQWHGQCALKGVGRGSNMQVRKSGWQYFPVYLVLFYTTPSYFLLVLPHYK